MRRSVRLENVSALSDLSTKITSKKATIGIVGMGYVGSALAELIIANEYTALGFVTTAEKAEKINNQKKKRLQATTNFSLLKNCDVILVCVQTPIYEDKTPNLRFLENALKQIANNLKKDQLIIIESSISVGTTRNFVLPILEESHLQAGKDFFLSFSPERVDPGNKKFPLQDIPKVVSGFDDMSQELAALFYKKIMKKVVPVSSLETAEMVKLFENTFRLVNVSLVNELIEYTRRLGIDMWEVIDAAATKPFGFLPHYPGPGAGGHCIPVDPYYLLDDAKKHGIRLKLLEEAGNINDQQPIKIVQRTLEILRENSHKELLSRRPYMSNNDTMTNGFLEQKNSTFILTGQKGGENVHNGKDICKVLLIGISYKPDVNDVRESPALKIWKMLEEFGFSVSYHDPYVPQLNGFSSKDLSEQVIKEHDMIIITTNHSNIDYSGLLQYNKPILDTRNVYNSHRNFYVYLL